MKIKPARNSGEVVLEMNRADEPMLAAASNVPFKLRKILVPMDFSDCSKKALQYALPFATQHGAAITLLYVVSTPYYPGVEFGCIDFAAIEADAKASGEAELAKLSVDALRGAVEANTLVRLGSPGLQIVELAKSMPADLIVISTHGRTGLKHVLLGSVAEHVVRHAPCPVFVVREKEREFV